MGRSVSIPSGAVLVAYDHLEFEPQCLECGQVEDYCGCENFESDGGAFAAEDFDWYCDDISDRAGRLWPSLRDAGPSCWAGREDRVLRENELVQFGISEYCGLVAIWIRPRTDGDAYREYLAAGWIDRIADRFQGEFGKLYKAATFSNGEAIFRRAA